MIRISHVMNEKSAVSVLWLFIARVAVNWSLLIVLTRFWPDAEGHRPTHQNEDPNCPPLKHFYWPFQGGISFVDHLCFWVLCLSYFHICSLLPCGHLLGKGWPLGPCWWYLLYCCYFPKWYPGSGVVLNCIVSWSLLSFLLPVCNNLVFFNIGLVWFLYVNEADRLGHTETTLLQLIYYLFYFCVSNRIVLVCSLIPQSLTFKIILVL